ncbi:MAG: hypothetical protein EA367_03255 [Leptolyngbya sp. DLM2.Bin15]|nr:MAG: hypothetical protein EA367_03255 [Leptolyngbya sp. DLM2.Bin15]
MIYSSTQPPTSPSSPADTSLDICEAIVFQSQGYRFALPLAAVLRIVQRSAIAPSYPTLEQERIQVSRLVLLFEGEPIRLIDLSRQLLEPSSSTSDRTSSPSSIPVDPFVMVAQTHDSELMGIPTPNPPEVIKLPLHQIMPLPPSYRNQIGNLAHHAVIMPHADSPLILLLDLQALLSGQR